MSGISMLLNLDNHESVAQRIVDQFEGKNVNFFVCAYDLGIKEPKITRFCARKLSGLYTLIGSQVRLIFLPNYKIFWDLSNEVVTARFDFNGDVVLSRVFTKEQHSKIVKITEGPI